METPALAVHDIKKAFGTRRALDGVSFDLPQGAFLSIFGPNGAGKTTLLRILSTVSRPTAGSLTMLGIDALENPEELRGRIGLISHKPMVYGDLTAMENLEFFAKLYGVPDARNRILDLLELVELDHRRNDAARTFSRGMTQRLSIARALLRKSPILLLDEATSSLDVATERKIRKHIREDNTPRTCIVTTHRPTVLSMCNRVYEIREKKCVILEQEEIEKRKEDF